MAAYARTSSSSGLLTPPPDCDSQCPLKHSISLPSSHMVLRFRAGTRRTSLSVSTDSESDPQAGSPPRPFGTTTAAAPHVGRENLSTSSSEHSPSHSRSPKHSHSHPRTKSPAPLPPPPTSAHDPGSQPPITSSSPDSSSTAFELWKQARSFPSTLDPTQPALAAGSHRPLTFRNVLLAFHILRASVVQLFLLLWTDIHPLRIVLFLCLNLVRGLLPPVRSYSQSLLLDQIHASVRAQAVSPRLALLLALEFSRMLFEAVFEHYATENERAVQQSIRFRVEYMQMETRLRLDIPSLSDPVVQDLLVESDLFSQSFNGVGGALGLMSPFDLMRTLTMAVTEIVGQSYVLYTLLGDNWRGNGRTDMAQAMVVGIALLPSLMSWANWMWTNFVTHDDSEVGTPWPHALYNPEEAETAERHERMRRLALDPNFKSEIMLFGLRKWILNTWAETRDSLMKSDRQRSQDGYGEGSQSRVVMGVRTGTAMEFMRNSTRELTLTLQSVPLIFQLTSGNLGNATLYRTSIQTILAALQSLSRTFQLTYQSIFLLGAFHAAMILQPSMEPPAKAKQVYKTAENADGKRTGMKIEAQNLWFTYPGDSVPVIRGLNLKVEPGEVVAIVGKNGCGKSTLMHLLLRLFDYDRTTPSSSEIPSRLLINDRPAEDYSPEDIHAHSTAVFQNFAKLTNSSVRENAGIGEVDRINDDGHLKAALRDGGAWDFVQGLRDGLETRLEANTFGGGSGVGGRIAWGPRQTPSIQLGPPPRHHKVALSGGQWQRLALARSFMRSDSDLLVLDEASSQLDAHAQNEIFSHLLTPTTRGKRTIIFITHRLSTVRWADKVAFFDEGQIKEFGTHDELMSIRNGGYRSLYGAFDTGSGTALSADD